MKRVFLFLALFLSTAVFAETVDKILAKVGGEVITLTEFNDAVKNRKVALIQQFGEKDGMVKFKEYEKSALEDLILQRVLEFEIRREKISITDAQVEDDFKIRQQQSGLEGPDFIAYLQKFGLSLPVFKENIRNDLKKREFIQRKIMPKVGVSDFDLQAEYEKRKQDFLTYKKFRFTEIFLDPSKLGGNDQVVKVLNAIGTLLFNNMPAGEVIRKYSSGVYADKGGDSGWIEATSLRKELREMLTKMKVGEVSRPLPMGPGVMIVKLTDRAEPYNLPLAEVMPFLRMVVSDRAVQDELKNYLLGVRDQTFVEIVK